MGGLRLLLFHFLSAPPCLLAGEQMAASVSSSSSPNWHLTAAPHGLLAACVSFLFSVVFFVFFCPSVGSISAASNITQLRGHFPSTTFTPPLPLILELSHKGSSLRPQALIIAFLSQPVPLKSIPSSSQPVAYLNPPPTSRRRHQDIEEVLHPGSQPREPVRTADIWPQIQNLIFI